MQHRRIAVPLVAPLAQRTVFDGIDGKRRPRVDPTDVGFGSQARARLMSASDVWTNPRRL